MSKHSISTISFLFALMLFPFPSWAKMQCSKIFIDPAVAWMESNYNEAQNYTLEYKSPHFLFPDYQKSFQTARKKKNPLYATYERLGFKWLEDGTFKGPTMKELPELVTKEYERQGVPEHARLTPGWIYENTVLRDNNRIQELTNVAFNTPFRDFLVAHERVVPGRRFAKSFAQGYFPISPGNTHDMGHMVSFLTYPRYAEAMIKAFKFHVENSPSRARNNRLYYFFEILELPHQFSPGKIKTLLKYPHFSESPTNLNHVKEYFKHLPAKDFSAYVTKLARSFEDFFSGYGGGSGNIPERFYLLNGTSKEHSDFMHHFFIRNDYHKAVEPYGGGVVGKESLHYMGRFLEVINSFRGKANTKEAREYFDDPHLTEAKLDIYTREFVARMEYAIWEGAKLKVEDTITISVENYDREVPYTSYIREVLGDYSQTYRSLHGRQ